MRGLRTQEKESFKRFFEKVQEAARKQNKVFFMSSGECEDISFEDMEIDSLFGWLIPSERADEFDLEFREFRETDKWTEFLLWCIPDISNGLSIEFRDF